MIFVLIFQVIIIVGVYSAPTEDMTAMLTVIQRMTSPDPSWEHEEPTPCAWAGITCDADERVVKIDWGPLKDVLEGRLQLDYLPRELRELRLVDLDVVGAVTMAKLPRKLRIFDVRFSRFYGLMDVASLPRDLEEFRISANSFNGTLNLYSIPPKMKLFEIDENKVTGEAQLHSLPSTMTVLRLNDNLLSGAVHLTNLPPALETLDLSNNRFCGPLNLTMLPSKLKEVLLFENQFCGELNLEYLPCHVRLGLYSNEFCGASNFSTYINLCADTTVDENEDHHVIVKGCTGSTNAAVSCRPPIGTFACPTLCNADLITSCYQKCPSSYAVRNITSNQLTKKSENMCQPGKKLSSTMEMYQTVSSIPGPIVAAVAGLLSPVDAEPQQSSAAFDLIPCMAAEGSSIRAPSLIVWWSLEPLPVPFAMGTVIAHTLISSVVVSLNYLIAIIGRCITKKHLNKFHWPHVSLKVLALQQCGSITCSALAIHNGSSLIEMIVGGAGFILHGILLPCFFLFFVKRFYSKAEFQPYTRGWWYYSGSWGPPMVKKAFAVSSQDINQGSSYYWLLAPYVLNGFVGIIAAVPSLSCTIVSSVVGGYHSIYGLVILVYRPKRWIFGNIGVAISHMSLSASVFFGLYVKDVTLNEKVLLGRTCLTLGITLCSLIISTNETRYYDHSWVLAAATVADANEEDENKDDVEEMTELMDASVDTSNKKGSSSSDNISGSNDVSSNKAHTNTTLPYVPPTAAVSASMSIPQTSVTAPVHEPPIVRKSPSSSFLIENDGYHYDPYTVTKRVAPAAPRPLLLSALTAINNDNTSKPNTPAMAKSATLPISTTVAVPKPRAMSVVKK
eukprot:PhF_6_TR38124/c0_g1_i1/m.56917